MFSSWYCLIFICKSSFFGKLLVLNLWSNTQRSKISIKSFAQHSRISRFLDNLPALVVGLPKIRIQIWSSWPTHWWPKIAIRGTRWRRSQRPILPRGTRWHRSHRRLHIRPSQRFQRCGLQIWCCCASGSTSTTETRLCRGPDCPRGLLQGILSVLLDWPFVFVFVHTSSISCKYFAFEHLQLALVYFYMRNAVFILCIVL